MIKKLTLLGLGLMLIGIVGVIATGFNFGDDLPYHEKKWSFPVDELQKLIIQTGSDSIDIEWIESTDGTGYVEFRGNLEQKNFDLLEEAELSNGTLKINIQQKRMIQLFSMQFGSSDRQLIVALPRDYMMDSLIVNASSANIYIDHAKANNIEITSASGRLSINELFANQLKLVSGSGNIRAKDITANTNATSSSGKIQITNLLGEGSINSGSGNITVVQLGTNTLDVGSDSGNVYITPSSQFNGFYDLQSSSGSIKAPESKRETTDLIKVRTSSGNIRVTE